MGKNRRSGGGANPNQSENPTPNVEISKELENDLLEFLVEQNQISSIDLSMQEAEEDGYDQVNSYDTYGHGDVNQSKLDELHGELEDKRKEIYKRLEDETGLPVVDDNMKHHWHFAETGDYVRDLPNFENEVDVWTKIPSGGTRVVDVEVKEPTASYGGDTSKLFTKDSFTPVSVISPQIDRNVHDVDKATLDLNPSTVYQFNGKTFTLNELRK